MQDHKPNRRCSPQYTRYPFHTKNWGSEPLIRNHNAARQKAVSFSHATSPKERLKHGGEFLLENAKALDRAGSSILGYVSWEVFDGYRWQRSIVEPIGRVWTGRSRTAFKVGRGDFALYRAQISLTLTVYFTHDHNDSQIRGIAGRTPVNQLGEEFTLDARLFQFILCRRSTNPSTDKWSRDKLSPSRVMRKTLQQEDYLAQRREFAKMYVDVSLGNGSQIAIIEMN